MGNELTITNEYLNELPNWKSDYPMKNKSTRYEYTIDREDIPGFITQHRLHQSWVRSTGNHHEA